MSSIYFGQCIFNDSEKLPSPKTAISWLSIWFRMSVWFWSWMGWDFKAACVVPETPDVGKTSIVLWLWFDSKKIDEYEADYILGKLCFYWLRQELQKQHSNKEANGEKK